MKKTKRRLWLVVGIGLALALAFALWKGNPVPERHDPPGTVATSTP
ncbi:MAG: hypothetical protein WBX15_05200 [Thermoanaerobaculia bacterium]